MHATRAVRIGFCVAVAILLIVSVSGLLDRQGRSYLDSASQRAFNAFVLGKSLNALISFTQRIQVSAGGVLTSAPGEALDPLDDLVERFSTAVMIAWLSLKIQVLLLGIFSHPAVTGAVALAAVVALFSAARGRYGSLVRISLALLTLRLWAPLSAGASTVIHEMFLERTYLEASQQAGAKAPSGTAPESFAPEPEAPGYLSGWLDALTGQLPSILRQTPELLIFGAGQLPDAQETSSFMAAPERAIEALVDLMTIFAFETVLIPILSLYLLKMALVTISRAGALG